MSQAMADLLENQQQTIEAMSQLLANFKKAGIERRTPDYIRRRLETLDAYWQDFQTNHVQLSGFSDKSSDYFTQNHYQQTKEFYVSARENIKKSITAPIIRPATPLAGMSKPILEQTPLNNSPEDTMMAAPLETPKFKSQGTNRKLDELLKKQSANFKAFSRAVSNININNITEKWEFQDTLKTLEGKWSAIDSLHWELDGELEGKDQAYDDTYTAYEVTFNKMKRSLNSKLWSVSYREKTTPKLEVPVFNGNYHQWVSFKDLFSEAIHYNPSLSPAQKMQFLKAKVKGEAEGLIQHLHISSDNYSVCWDILNHRYNNKKLIFTSHINILLNLPVMQQPSLHNIKRIHDTTQECLNSIKNLGVDISTWDPLLVHLLSNKLDAETHTDYVESLSQPRELPILSEFLQFLETKFTSMETSKRKQDAQKPSSSNTKPFKENNFSRRPSYLKQSYSSNKGISQYSKDFRPTKICPLCKNTHGLYQCEQFIEMSSYNKKQTVSKLRLCENCLYSHNGKACFSTKRCRECDEFHNTLLHEAYSQPQNKTLNPATSKNPITRNSAEQPQKMNSHVAQQRDIPEILLATSLVKVQKSDGSYLTLRALIDQGSQTSLITENAAQQLCIPRQKCKGVITGIGVKDNTCKGNININCTSLDESYTFNTDVFIMRSLTKNLPSYTFTKPNWAYLEHIELADPEFYISRPIDILFGADIYSHIILEGIYRLDQSIPIAQQTRLGWILCGNVHTSLQCNVVRIDVDQLQRFWEVEDISEAGSLSSDDHECIQFYNATTTRNIDGRYVVRMPLKPNYQDNLGNSRSKAIAQFSQLERRLNKQANIAHDYKSFMNEYLTLGHMKPANCNSNLQCFLPHHCVLRDDSLTTSLRVVFNASSKTSSGYSLNDLMHKGPNLQQDLQTLILKFRQYQFAFTADIEKMFRQILVHEEDKSLQIIVWRNHPNEKLQEYQLNTVTYGTKAAPFLAMMTLKRLANDEQCNYPEAAKVVQESVYMFDVLHGCHSLKIARELQRDLIALLKKGGFNLRKWASNSSLLYNDSIISSPFTFKQPESTKTLGLRWNPVKDTFSFGSTIDSANIKATKRSVLSDISKVFDPLGWLTPITTKLKLLFQTIWEAKIEWDEQIPEKVYKEWIKIKADIINIREIQVPRWLGMKLDHRVELHGFCDSSVKAYACVIYCKIKQEKPTVSLVAAKSRAVPCNKNISLPRLELCGAQLLAKLMSKVIKCFVDYQIDLYGWTDSTAVLGWIQGDPGRWQSFIGNRTRQITSIMPSVCWRYVKSGDNPADCASRGLLSQQLIEHTLWWQGPSWLKTYQHEDKQPLYTTDLELKKNSIVNIVVKQEGEIIIQQLIMRNSSYMKVVRILAWIRRFIKCKQDQINTYKQPYLSLQELNRAKLELLKHVQQQAFSSEIVELSKNKKIKLSSKIICLNPYLDKEGILRVGGRLNKAFISEDVKHPIILPNNTRLTDLIIDYGHKLTFHGGPKLTSAFLRQRFWILGGNRSIKKHLRLCVTCRKHNPEKHFQLMGDLPESRCNPSKPFSNVGVDYTGFIDVKANKGGGIKTTKGYVALFVCMATKAVHLELVSDLSTSSFLAALRRMAARRGTPRHIYSDNGTNFVGANHVLQQQFYDLQQKCMPEITNMEIEWHFNAPSWPSAGGLWEAGVKSLKYHMRRVIGEQKLTYEELYTILTQIEACLNSRPLCTLSEDPQDLDCLTPSHFLSSGPNLTIWETEKDLRIRWQLVQKIYVDIWNRWRTEYLTQMNARAKWRHPQNNIKINDVVLINDLNMPPGKWAMGRVMELHPGRDGHVRVVTVKTKNGLMKRPVVKLSVLPVHEETNQSYRQTKGEEKRSRKKCSFSVMATTFLLFFMSLLCTTHCTYNIKTLPQNQSLFFDKFNNMHLVRDNWNLVVYFNMNPYWSGITALSKYIEYLDNVCKHIGMQTHCEEILTQLNHGYQEIQHYNDLLLNQHFDARARNKRGLINGVGYLANTLFGVLDERFASNYERDIKTIKSNQNHMALLWKNQTSIVEAEFNLLKRTETFIDRQYKSINQKLLAFQNDINKFKYTLQNITTITDFTMTSIIANNLLHKLSAIQDKLLDTVTDIFHGKINLHLISPEQLKHELDVISGQLPKDLSSPIDGMEFAKIYHLLKIRARMLEKYFIFEIKIPLIARDTYDVLKIIPVPHRMGSNMVEVVPVSEYVAINLNKDALLLLTETDLRSCVQQGLDTILCDIGRPEYSIKDDQSLCYTTEQTGACKVNIIPCTNKWTEVYKLNQYFYFCCEQCHIRLLCPNQITALHLSQSGLLSVGQGCIIKSQNFTLYSKNQLSSRLDIQPDLEVVDIAPINHLINISIPYMSPVNSDLDNHQELTKIRNQLDDIKRSTPLAENVRIHDIHHYAAIYVIFSVMGAVGLYATWQRVRRLQQRRVAATDNSPEHRQEAGFLRPAGSTMSVAAPCDNTKCCDSVKCARVAISESDTGEVASASVVRKDVGTSPIIKSVFTISDN